MKANFKISLILFLNIIFTDVAVSAFNSKHLYALTVNNSKPELRQIIANSNPDGMKIVSNNSKKREVQVAETQPKNSIKNIFEGDDGILNISLELIDEKTEVKISVFNMLGKEVRKIYQGLPLEKDDEGYFIFASKAPLNLPKNVYILVVQGNTFRIADRFVVTK